MRRIFKISFLLLIMCFISLLSSCVSYIEVGYDKLRGEIINSHTIRTRVKAPTFSSQSHNIEVGFGFAYNFNNATDNIRKNSDFDQVLKFSLYRVNTNKLYAPLSKDDIITEIYTYTEKLEKYIDSSFYIENTIPFIDTVTKEDVIGFNYLAYYCKIKPVDDAIINFWYGNESGELFNPMTEGGKTALSYWTSLSCWIKCEINGENIKFSKARV